MTILVYIDHEVGNLSEYTYYDTGGGSMAVTAGSALGGSTRGLSITMNGVNSPYAAFAPSPFLQNTTQILRARVYVDPNGIDIPANGHVRFMQLDTIYAPNLAEFHLYRNAGDTSHAIVVSMGDDAGVQHATSLNLISDAPHYVEIMMVRASSDVASDGEIVLLIDGVPEDTVFGIDNYDMFATQYFLQVGVLSSPVGIIGTFYVDETIIKDSGPLIGPYTVRLNITRTEGVLVNDTLLAIMAVYPPIYVPPNASTLGQYYVTLKDHTGTQVAVFDTWEKLEYTNEVNGIGSYQLVLDGNDERVEYFDVDYQVEIWRKVPGMRLDWYLDFEGLHRKQERSISKDGVSLYTSSGAGYNDLLARTVIAFKEGTIRAEKNDASETVMKEFVTENCTALADDFSVVGRLNYDEHYNDETGAIVYYAALPGFSVEGDTGGGINWEGERAYENLLSTLQDVAVTSGIDFSVVGNGPALFQFRTYLDGIGRDMRNAEVNSSSGLNAYGNRPVLFSVPYGTVEQITYTSDRMSESNAVMVLGEGELSLREVYTVANVMAQAASPWNRREVTRPGSNQDTIEQNNQLGREVLKDNAVKELMNFDPLQTRSHCYGVHYKIGDIVTASFGPLEMHKKLTKITVTMQGVSERIAITFTDLR
jgi:hypothetical protein